MTDETTTIDAGSRLTLRPLPGSPWIRNHWAYDYSWLDLRGMLPDGAVIEEVTLNGVALKLYRQEPGCRPDSDHPHLFRVSPPVRLEAGYLVVTVKAPQSPEDGRPRRAMAYPHAAAAPAPTYGLTPRGSP